MPAINPAQYSWIGFGKETTFGTLATMAYWPGAETFSPSPKNTPIFKNDSRNRSGRSYPSTGQYDWTASLRPAAQPDVLFPWLKYIMGAQTAPALYTYYTGTTSGSTTIGSNTVFTVIINPISYGVAVGDTISVDSAGNQENCTVTARTSTTITVTATTKNHASGVTITATSTTAYSSTISFATSLPSVSLEYALNASDARDYLGVTGDTLKLACAPGQLLQADFGLVAASESINTSPTTPSFPTSDPLHNEAQVAPLNAATSGAAVLYKGSPLAVNVMGWSASLNNNLKKDFRTAGLRTVTGFPLGRRDVSGSLKLSYADAAIYKDLLGAATATGPQATVPGVSISIPIASQTLVDSTHGIPYQLVVSMPNVFITDVSIPEKVDGAFEQTVNFQAAETAGNNNDLQLAVLTAASAVY